MGNLRNCKRCGALFVYNGNPLCQKCIAEDEEIYKMVREYIEEHPKSTTFQVSEALDVPVDKILQFLREGKLELSDENINMLLACERCGTPIRSGRYCAECSLAMEEKLLGRSARRDSYGRTGRITGGSKRNQMYTVERRKRR